MSQFGNIHFGGDIDMSSHQSKTDSSGNDGQKKGNKEKKQSRKSRRARPIPKPSTIGDPSRFSDLSLPVHAIMTTVYEECYAGYDPDAYDAPMAIDIRPVLDGLPCEQLPALQANGAIVGTYDSHKRSNIDADTHRVSNLLIDAIAMYASDLGKVTDYAYSGNHLGYDVILSREKHDDYMGYRAWRQSIVGTALESQIMKDGKDKIHAVRLNAVKRHVIRASRDSKQNVAKLAGRVLESHANSKTEDMFDVLIDIGSDTGCFYMDDRRYLKLQKSGDNRFENPDCPVLLYDDVDNGGPMDWNGEMAWGWVNVRPLLDTVPLDKLPVPFAMDAMLNGDLSPISDEENDPDYDDARDVFWDYCRGSEIPGIEEYVDFAESNDRVRDDSWGYSSYPNSGFGISLRGDKDEDRDELDRDLDYFDYLRWRRTITADMEANIAKRGEKIIRQLHMAAIARRIEDECRYWCNSGDELREALSAIVSESKKKERNGATSVPEISTR